MIKKILTLIILTLLCVISLNGAPSSGVNVILANQNPDPVSPGNFVYVNVKISNPGGEPIEDVSISFEENNYFSLAPGVSETKEIGILPQYSSADASSSYVIAKYKVYVAPTTPIGLNTLTFNIDSSKTDFSVDLDLLVQDTNPVVEVSSFSINPVESGKSTQLNLTLQNNNNVEIKDVVLTLNLDEVENNVISVEKGSNQKRVGTLIAGNSVDVPFTLTIAPDATAKPYLLPLTIEYEDSLGITYSQKVMGSVRVFSTPQLSVQVDSQEIYTQGNGRITLAIANPGTSAVKGVQVELLDSDAYKVLEGKKQYLGDMNPDDFQTLQSDIYLTGEEGNLEVKLTYLDSYNSKKEEILSLNLTTFNEEELQKYGISSQNESSGVIGYVISLVLIIIAFVIGRKYGFKKAKKKFSK